jgi:hypothetical protein
VPISPDVIQAIETEYSVRFTADETDAARSALDLYRLLLRKLGLVPGHSIGASACVFYRLRRELMKQYNVDRERVRPSSRLGDILPKGNRWTQVQELVEKVGVGFWMPDIPIRDQKMADNWTYGILIVLIIIPLLALFGHLAVSGHDPGTIAVLVVLVGIAYPLGKSIHGWLTRRALLRAAHVTDAGTLRQLVASCLGPRGDRISLYDWRIRWLFRDFLEVLALHADLSPVLLTANIALRLDEHPRVEVTAPTPEAVAKLTLNRPLPVQRECLAQVVASFMRGEITSFDVWGLLFTLQWSEHEQLQPLAVALAHVVDSKNDYPIIVSEEDWDYLRRMIAALRSDLILEGNDFRGSDARHRPPEVALEPFWTRQQWLQCEPLLAELELPEFDPELHSSPAAARALRPRVEIVPRGVYRTVMVRRRDRAQAGLTGAS